ncbi:MAG: hypothetical protein KDD53_02490 [Bdellovibrionales bacterium]|nr:hypothetical protein [Bdellovibrionales bacterium]
MTYKTTTPSESDSEPFPFSKIRLFITFLVFALIYVAVRYPLRDLTLAYYDDGETLYHALCALQGKIPYRDDINHHFYGYIIPYIIFAKFFGISTDLLSIVSTLHQSLTAIGVMLCSSLFVSYPWAILSGLLALLAREPYVFGYQPPYQVNTFWIWVLYGCLRYIRTEKTGFLLLSCALAGIAATFDQRALLVVLIPIATSLLVSSGSLKSWTLAFLFYIFVPACALFYLKTHDALKPFFEQTWIYPRQFRAGSFDLGEIFRSGIEAHKYLFTESPLLFLAFLFGLVYLIRFKNHSKEKFLLLISIVPQMAFSFSGSRDYSYYTATWLPYLSLLAILPACKFRKFSNIGRASFLILSCGTIFLAIVGSINLSISRTPYRGDGAIEVSQYLESQMQPTDTLYVWGYRFDPYIYLNRCSNLAFGSRIFIHPDDQITTEREKHIYPKYEEMFAYQMKNNSPDYVVVFKYDKKLVLTSPSEALLFSILDNCYLQTHQVDSVDFRGVATTFTVFKKIEVKDEILTSCG